IGGGAPTAGVRAVDDIIVDQRCAVQKLNNCGETDGAVIFAARVACGKKQESGTHALPASAQQIRSDFGNRRKSGFALPRKLFFDQEEVVANEIKNLFSREQRDGKSPNLAFVFKTWGRQSCRPGKAEEAPKILRSGGGNFVRRQVSHTRKRARYFRNVGRLVALAAPGLRRKVRRVCFNQNLLERQSFRNVAKVLRFRIS